MALTFKPNPAPGTAAPVVPVAPQTQPSQAAPAVELRNPLAHLGIQGTLVSVGPGRRARSPKLEAETLFNKFWAISKPALAALVAEYQAGYDDEGDGNDEEEVPYLLTDDGIGCIPVMGPLSKKMSWRGMAYSEITAMVLHAVNNPACKSILLCVDSPGGTVSGMFEACDALYEMRGQKPMAAISDDNCYSAAYCLATAADKLFCVNTGGVGSIGCWMAHVDLSEMLKNEGVKVTLVYAGAKKVDGNMYEPLSDRAHADMQDEADRIRGMFVSAVARNRSVSADALMATEAGIFMGASGIPLLCDYMGGVEDAMTYLRGRMAETTDNPEMPEENDEIGVLGTNQVLRTPDGKFTLMLAPTDAGTTITFPANFPNNGFLQGGDMHAAAIPYSKTETSDAAWDGPKAKANLKADQKASYYRRAYAWQQGGSDGTKKNQFRFIHHFVSNGGDIGAASTVACSAGIAVLNGGRSGTTIPSADRKGVYDHLAAHLKAAGKTPPPLKSEAELAESLASLEALDVATINLLMSGVGLQYNGPVTLAEQSFSVNGVVVGGDADIGAERSIAAFGKPGVVLAVRSNMPANCLAASTGETGRKLTMLAVPYDGSVCNLGAFDERYAPGAFSSGLNHDPRVLISHNEEKILGRRSAGTAKFWESSAGVHAEVENLPDTSYANDMLVSMKRGDVSQASAAFWILESSWEIRGDRKVRVVQRAILRDASVVAFAAYKNTSATVEQTPGASVDLLKKKLALLSI